MLTTLALLAASLMSFSPLPADPSLGAAATAGMPTVPAEGSVLYSNTGEVLDYDGILLTWDGAKKSFSLWLGGKAVDDLVTSSDSSGNPTFAGLFTGNNPGVSGAVVSASNDKWTVDINRPSHHPERFSVVAAGNDAEVTAAKTCDCADGIGLTCKTTDCDAGNSCSAGTSTCKWKTTGPGGTSH